jgi:inner membrane protein involved in colicin E2 resistance
MGNKQSTEFDNFDKVMDGLLSVPYSELQKKLEEEKKAKQKKKRATSSSPASRASSSRKKQVA